MTYRYLQFTPLLRAWPTVLLCAVLGLVFAILLSLIRPLKYDATTKILITQKLSGADAYTASRSAERIADDLTLVLYTSDFFSKVMASSYGIDENYFSTDEIKRRKEWQETVSASVSYSSGIMEIRAYHANPEEAKKLAAAVADVYVTQGSSYISGSDITVQVVDEPLSSRYPVKPNLPVNGLSGLFLGAIAGGVYAYIQDDKMKRGHRLIHDEEG